MRHESVQTMAPNAKTGQGPRGRDPVELHDCMEGMNERLLCPLPCGL